MEKFAGPQSQAIQEAALGGAGKLLLTGRYTRVLSKWGAPVSGRDLEHPVSARGELQETTWDGGGQRAERTGAPVRAGDLEHSVCDHRCRPGLQGHQRTMCSGLMAGAQPRRALTPTPSTDRAATGTSAEDSGPLQCPSVLREKA